MEMPQKYILDKSVSEEVSGLPPGWKPRPPEDQLNPEEIAKSSWSTLSSSSDTALQTTQTLEVCPSYYVIADDTEDFQVESTGVHFRTLDCVEKGHFWTVLLENLKLYQDLTNSYNALTREEIENRQELLAKLLRKEGWKHRLSVLVYTAKAAEVERFAPWKWMGARISFDVHAKDDGELFEGALKGVPKGTMYFITPDLLADLARTGNVIHEDISDLERELLDEIFSLNHIPDAPLDNGGTTEPAPVPVPPTIVLNEGGFSFEGGGAEFWKEGDYETGEVVDIPDETIELYPRAGKAYCRTTKEEFDVKESNPKEDEYVIFLHSDTRCFEIRLYGNHLKAMPVQPAEWVSEPEEVTEEGETVVVAKASKGLLRSPLKEIKNNTVGQSNRKFSPRKRILGRDCRIDLSDKENVDPQCFSNYPMRTSANKAHLELGRDLVYRKTQKNSTIKKLF